MLQSVNEDLIVSHRLVVSLLLLLYLLQKQLFLHKGIVKLSVSVSELMVLDKQLKSLSQSRLRSVVLGKR